MDIYALARDKKMYDAKAAYEGGIVTVLEGSKINRTSNSSAGVKRAAEILRNDDSLFRDTCILNCNLEFNSLSTAATFVTGRVANGMIVWKTEDGKNIKVALNGGGKK